MFRFIKKTQPKQEIKTFEKPIGRKLTPEEVEAFFKTESGKQTKEFLKSTGFLERFLKEK